ncbi:structural maintenance of chromosomes protein 5-like [Papaver somniferum]|uniref:structural maintenance of chromosomes protein 5-like n=1 Tax=Papaver somniferum TaxID=3469 RepID=UPI000E6F8CBA|nr:structural maintenance of chromosomes protein 5-like [Papaver somniferum]
MRFSAKRKSRSEIFSRIDPSVHIALGFLESHCQMILAEGYFKSNNHALQLALEKEVNKLKGKLQTVTLEREKLRSKNQELRDLNQKRVLERYDFQFAVEDARADNEKLLTQISQLHNEHSYSLDQIENLTSENVHLTQQCETLGSQIYHLSKLLFSADLTHQTLSEENQSLSIEKRSFLKKEAMFSHQYLVLQKICDNQEQSLRTLRNQFDESTKTWTTPNEKVIQSKINLTVKMNQFQEQYAQLKESHDSLMKEKVSLSLDEKKIRSRLKGLVGDDFDKAMENMKNSGSALAQYLISQREESEKLHQSTISWLGSDLTKARKERAKFSTALISSRDRSERRCSYLQSFVEIGIKNAEKAVARDAHIKAQTLVNNILLEKSLPLVTVPPLDISDDEQLPVPDSDYEYVSDEEEDLEVPLQENQLEKDGSDEGFSKDPNSEMNVEASVVDQDASSNDA